MENKPETLRIDRLLSAQGLGSRKAVRQLLRAGRVTVDGKVVTEAGYIVDPELAEVVVGGQILAYQRFLYLMMHKPQGLITAADDPRLPTVLSLLDARYRASGVMPVGRLDRDTTGLLLLTNNGPLAHHLLSPKRHVPKTYRVTVDQPLENGDVEAFANGIPLSDFTAKPAALRILSPYEGLLTLTEGKYHQVKRMMGVRGKGVVSLARVAFGPLALDQALSPGQTRPLTPEEVEELNRAVAKAPIDSTE